MLQWLLLHVRDRSDWVPQYPSPAKWTLSLLAEWPTPGRALIKTVACPLVTAHHQTPPLALITTIFILVGTSAMSTLVVLSLVLEVPWWRLKVSSTFKFTTGSSESFIGLKFVALFKFYFSMLQGMSVLTGYVCSFSLLGKQSLWEWTSLLQDYSILVISLILHSWPGFTMEERFLPTAQVGVAGSLWMPWEQNWTSPIPLAPIVGGTQYEWGQLLMDMDVTPYGFLHWNTTQHMLLSHILSGNEASCFLTATCFIS